jgi:hypothetical protein
MQAYQALTALAAPLGLHAQQTKGPVYSADDAAAAHIARYLKVRHAREGLLAAGTPVGTPAFQAARADICADHAYQLLDELQVLPLADQDRWLLLHGSLQRRVAHLPRGNQWQHVGQAVQRAESKAVDGAFALLQQARVEGPLTAQITLPLQHGGLGLACTGPDEGRAAYLAAAAATHRAMLEGPVAFRPFDGPGGVELRAQWEALHDGAGDLWPPEVRDVNPDNLGVIADAQSTYSRHTATDKFTALLESFDAHSVDGRSARARFLSCACRTASAWLDTLSLTHTLELKSGEVRTSLRHRLGLSMMPPNAPTLLYSCGAALNGNTADHAM